jgi:hypothetical protein
VSKEPTHEATEAADWHRRFAIDLYNVAWTLLDSPKRTPDQDGELLAAAFGSRWHWGQVGSDEQWAVGDWFIGHVSARLGLGDVALRFSRRALERVEAMGGGDWLLASTYEGMARAHAAAGDKAERDAWFGRAIGALDDISDPEDRELIASQLASIP